MTPIPVTTTRCSKTMFTSSAKSASPKRPVPRRIADADRPQAKYVGRRKIREGAHEGFRLPDLTWPNHAYKKDV